MSKSDTGGLGMNQLKAWGFSSQWWRGDRGEYWVILQITFFIAFALLPVYPNAAIVMLPTAWQYGVLALAALLGVIAVSLLIGGVIALGTNLTPLPHPRDEGTLVTSGVYGLVRHPIYSSVIFAAIAYSLWQWSLSHAVGAVVLFLFLDMKARKEESWLQEKFADYELYRSQVKKLIPWLY
jgi:protein-S-isoprenylcysteine O-methyltransferase Ste14